LSSRPNGTAVMLGSGVTAGRNGAVWIAVLMR
jgi:hypothetical protein